MLTHFHYLRGANAKKRKGLKMSKIGIEKTSAIKSSDKYTEKCLGCKTLKENPAEADLCLFQTDYCKVVMRDDDPGAWLGRCIIVPHAHLFSPSDLPSTNPELLLDIYRTRKIIETTYTDLFGMTILNWAQLGNLTRDETGNPTTENEYYHFHFHVIPRYQVPPVWDNRKWPDEQWGMALNIDPKKGHKKKRLGTDSDGSNDHAKLRQFITDVQLYMFNNKLVTSEMMEHPNPSEIL